MTTRRAPLCMVCSRFAATGFTCEAFPDGIPEAIIANQVDHRQPVAGDNGLRFAPTGKAGSYADDLFPAASKPKEPTP